MNGKDTQQIFGKDKQDKVKGKHLLLTIHDQIWLPFPLLLKNSCLPTPLYLVSQKWVPLPLKDFLRGS